ncbi:MAG: CDP-alcohol phosphatidyltransferase family protein [Alphaproteobacteria bacterium]|nr:CDP-alcohol phosphatidyltransferase family protein [Alphaproteobacteria bacterium]
MRLISILPNLLSISRILVSPLFIYTLKHKLSICSVICLIFGALSDFFDGYIARKFNVVSKLGALLDPLSDKIFTNIIFWSIYLYYGKNIYVLIIALTLSIRDLSLLIGSSLVILHKYNTNMAPIFLSKICTTLIFIFSIYYLLFPYSNKLTSYFGITCIVLIMITALIYLYRFLHSK